MKERKLQLFDVLNKLSIKDRTCYTSLSEDEKKEFLPVILMRWLSGTSDAKQVVFLNEFANPYLFDLYKHKELLADLLVVSTSGYPQRYQWMKGKSKHSSPVSIEVIKRHFNYNTSDAIDALPLFCEQDIIALAEGLGFQSDEIAKIKKEFKK